MSILLKCSYVSNVCVFCSMTWVVLNIWW